MSKLVVLITARVEDGPRLGEAWHEAGAPGVTFITSHGLRSLRSASEQFEVLPGMMSFLQIMRANEETSLMVLSLVEDDTAVDHICQATETILGDLLLPKNGILFVLDVERTLGVRDHRK